MVRSFSAGELIVVCARRIDEGGREKNWMKYRVLELFPDDSIRTSYRLLFYSYIFILRFTIESFYGDRARSMFSLTVVNEDYLGKDASEAGAY